MKPLFKINGERNSGTNFLHELFSKNKLRCISDIREGKIIKHWKHAIPTNDVKTLHSKVVNIIIFRQLDNWLQSMFNNQYHLKYTTNYEKFLTQKIIPVSLNEYDVNGNLVSYDDEGKTIFELRYYKIDGMLNFKKNNDDVILVSLEYLQNEDNVLTFLTKLNEKYTLNMTNYVLSINTHTKNRKITEKNRNYENCKKNDAIPQIIENNKNNNIEDFINELTFIL